MLMCVVLSCLLLFRETTAHVPSSLRPSVAIVLLSQGRDSFRLEDW